MFSRRGRLISLLVFALLTVGSVMGLTRLSFDFNFEAFLPEGDPGINFYTEFKEEFQPGTNNILVGLENPGGTFEQEFLQQVRRFTVCARKLPMVDEAFSLLTLSDVIYDPLAPMKKRVLNPKTSQDLKADSLRIMSDPRFPGNMISYDGKMLFVSLATPQDKAQSEEDGLIQALDDLLAEYGFEDAALVGYPIFHYHLQRYQIGEFALYTGVGTLIMLICMLVLFRRFWGTFVAFLSVFLGLIIFFGILGWSGKPIDLMGTLFPVLIVIVGTSDVVHIMTKYVDELRLGKDKQEALRITFREIGLATFMTSLTTAIGFLSLYSSNMPPIRNFGVFAAIGVFVAFGTVIMLTTALLSWFSHETIMKPLRGRKPFTSLLSRIEHSTRRRPRWIAWSALGFILLCGLGASQISLNLTTRRDLPYQSKIKEDFALVDKKIRGVNPMDVALEVSGGKSFFDLEVQQEMAAIEATLQRNTAYGSITSPLLFFRLMNMAWHGPEPENFRLAANQEEFEEQYAVAGDFLTEPLGTLLSPDGKSGWMYAQIQDVGSHEVLKLKTAFMAANQDREYIKMTQTGARHIFDEHQELLVFSLLKSLGLAICLVSLFMALVFRNWRLVIVSLIPNVFPLVATAGIIGVMGIQMDPKVAIVFTVAFGIAVDDSIHFLSRFKLERDKGMGTDQAIRNTFAETGRAIIITTIILLLGFGALVFSAFPPTFTIGFLLTLTLLIALIGDFFLLPILIRWMIPNRVKQ